MRQLLLIALAFAAIGQTAFAGRTCTSRCTRSVSFRCYTGWYYVSPTIRYTGSASCTTDGNGDFTDSAFDRLCGKIATGPCTAAEQAGLDAATCDKATECATNTGKKYCSDNGWSFVSP